MIDATASTAATSAGGKADTAAGLKAAAKQFEAIFIRQMISSMRASSLGDDLFGSDAGSQFRDMADARVADDMAGKGAFGIGALMLKQFMGRGNVTTAAPTATATATAAAAAAGEVPK